MVHLIRHLQVSEVEAGRRGDSAIATQPGIQQMLSCSAANPAVGEVDPCSPVLPNNLPLRLESIKCHTLGIIQWQQMRGTSSVEYLKGMLLVQY